MDKTTDLNDCDYHSYVVKIFVLPIAIIQCIISAGCRPLCLQCFDAVGWATGRASGL